MTDTKSSYRQIITSTSIFGGVQFFSILISVIRSKCIAVFIGPAGVGILGLFVSALNLMGSCTSFGIETSAVKMIASAENNQEAVAKEIFILKRLAWITGILGTLAVMVLSPFLSKITFGNYDYILAFVLISVTLLFKQLTNGELAILQGLHKIAPLAKANLFGNLFGLLVSLPLYFFLGIDGIVPSIVISSVVALWAAFAFHSNRAAQTIKLSDKEVFREGKSMIKLGLSLSFIGLLATASSYLLQIFISHTSGISEVGLYSAGFTILNTYVGVIFTAMATDYYPRLSKISHDNVALQKLVTQQSNMGILLLTPIVVVFLALAPHVIRLLYSKEFLPIVPLVCWGILGMIIKAVSWSMGYVLIAKGDSKMFVKTSIGFNTLFLIINLLGYHFYGLEGLGVTFAINYVIHFVGLKIITANWYNLHFDKEFYSLFAVCIFICVAAFVSLKLDYFWAKYLLFPILIVISFWFSFVQLNKRLHFKDFLSKKNKQ